MTAAPASLSGWYFRLTARAATRCREASRKSSAGLAFGAGLFSVLAMPPFFLSPVLFLTLPVLLWLTECISPAPVSRAAVLSRGFWPGWWFGFGYFLFGLFWIGEAFLVEAEHFLWALPFAVTLLPAGLALFFGIATAFTAVIGGRGIARCVSLALALSATEWLRGHILTGFPWNTLGYAVTSPLPLMQSVSLIGIYGLTLVCVLVFATPGVVLAEADPKNVRRALTQAIGIGLLPLLAMWGYGAARLSQLNDAPMPSVRFRIVQPSIPQRDRQDSDKRRPIFFDHLTLSHTTPSGADDPQLAGITHVIWPEAAMPFLVLQTPEALQLIGAMLPPGKELITGGLRLAQPGSFADVRNSMMVIGTGGEVGAIYDKIHLVPFGEYLPLRPLLEAIGLQEITRMRGGFGVGPKPRPLLDLRGLPGVSPLICYEAIFPAAVVQGEKRPSMLLNLTNDAWFGNTTGPRQHFHQARARAVEEGVSLVRAANNGISGVIAPSGRVTSQLALNVRGSLDFDVPAAIEPPLYARFGDRTFFFCWCLLALLRWRSRRPEVNPS